MCVCPQNGEGEFPPLHSLHHLFGDLLSEVRRPFLGLTLPLLRSMPRVFGTQVSDPDAEVKRYSGLVCEDTLATLERYRMDYEWIPPNYKPKTKLLIGVAERFWCRYVVSSCFWQRRKG